MPSIHTDQPCCPRRPSTPSRPLPPGEAEGPFPGLVVDTYGATDVVKLYTLSWLPHLSALLPHLVAPGSGRIVLRLARNVRSDPDLARLGLADGAVVAGVTTWGALPGDCPEEGRVLFRENGMTLEADPMRGQKAREGRGREGRRGRDRERETQMQNETTDPPSPPPPQTGFFLDQRDARSRIASLVASAIDHGRDRGEVHPHVTLLNLFSFSGGFSLSAARAGAAHVVDVDVSRHALDASLRNFAYNIGEHPTIGRCRHDTVAADVFAFLRGDDSSVPSSPTAPSKVSASSRSIFDVVVSDPPALTRQMRDVDSALRQYRELAKAAARRVSPGGALAAFSCSAHVSSEAFESATLDGARAAGRRPVLEGERLGHCADHPVRTAFPEGRYLKGVVLRLS